MTTNLAESGEISLSPSIASRTPRVVLFVHNSADLYGASRSLLRLASRLPARGIEPVVILPEFGPLSDALRSAGVAVHVQSGLSVITREIYKSAPSVARFLGGIPRSAFQIARVARATRADLIHTNTGVIVSPALASQICGIPHLWHIRDSFQEFGRLWSIYERYIRRLSSRVVCVSSAVAAQFCHDPSVIVVNNGFPLEEFAVDRAQLRREFRLLHGFGDDEVVIGVVGRIKFLRKGQEFAVEAIKRLSDAGIRCRLAIVGGTALGNEDHEGRLRELVDRIGLEGVVFTGELQDTRPAYAGIDVLVLPSAQPEPFGGVVIEGMAMGLPVVATSLGGSVDQVEHDVTGFLVPPADPAALAAALKPLVTDAHLRASMGAAGLQRMMTHFDIDQMIQRLLQVYESCTSSPLLSAAEA
jgi:glycosyltransferase involved in cell wall biosynthesis